MRLAPLENKFRGYIHFFNGKAKVLGQHLPASLTLFNKYVPYSDQISYSTAPQLPPLRKKRRSSPQNRCLAPDRLISWAHIGPGGIWVGRSQGEENNGSVLDQVARNKAVLLINRDHFFAHTDNPATAPLTICLVDDFKLTGFTAIRVRRFFDFQWMNLKIRLHKYINFLHIGVTIIRQVRGKFCICIILYQLHDYIIFKVMAACRAVHQRIPRQPHREKCAETCIAKIQLWRFGQTL